MSATRVGIVGAGQLGRMMALAGYPLGVRSLFLDRAADTPGGQVAPIVVADLEDAAALKELAERNEVVTFDWENISGSALAPIESLTRVRPPRAALEVSQDRIAEKALFSKLKIPVAPHAAIDSLADLRAALGRLGTPGILKTRRFGYDGKGQWMIKDVEDADAAWAQANGAGLIYEKFQPFSREVSIIGARSADGRCVFYPLAANTHGGGILRYSIAPYLNAALEKSARLYLKRLMNALSYVGVLTIEFFVVAGRLIANEMAPRVHNSGHWTIEGCIASQFENHVRAICDLPLGSTRAMGHAAMVNFLGEMPDRERLLSIEGLSYHDYGKSPRSGRKLGHCTIVQARAADRDRLLAKVLKMIQWS